MKINNLSPNSEQAIDAIYKRNIATAIGIGQKQSTKMLGMLGMDNSLVEWLKDTEPQYDLYGKRI